MCVLLWCWGVSSGVVYLFTRGSHVVFPMLGGSGGVGSWQRGELWVAGSVSLYLIMGHVAIILWVFYRVLSDVLEYLWHMYVFDMYLPTGGSCGML